MALPLRAFWLLSGNIDRIMAQKDMRAMSVAMVAQSTGEGVQAFRSQLVVEAGIIVKLEGIGVNVTENPLDAQPDEGAFALLQGMGNQKIGR